MATKQNGGNIYRIYGKTIAVCHDVNLNLSSREAPFRDDCSFSPDMVNKASND